MVVVVVVVMMERRLCLSEKIILNSYIIYTPKITGNRHLPVHFSTCMSVYLHPSSML